MGEVTKSWWFKVLIIGVFVRLVLMPITFHPDLWAFQSAAHFFAYDGVVNIYEHLANLPAEHPLVANIGVGDFFIYPPLYYFTSGLFRLITRPFTEISFMPMVWANNQLIFSYPIFHWHLFMFKLPYLFIDIAAAFLLTKLFSEEKRKTVFMLWMFNPLTLYATFMMGQLDILPVLFTILSLYYAKNKKYVWSLVSLGIGGSYKMYPLLLILPAAFVLGKNLKDKIKFSALGFLPYLLTIAPFLNTPFFRQTVLFNPKNQKMLFMGLNVSGTEVIYPFIALLVVIYLHSYYAKEKLNLAGYFFTILLLLLSVTHFHPQWFIWATPFLLWFLVKSRMKYTLLVTGLFVGWFVITLFFEASLSYGMLNPLWPQLGQAPSLTIFVDMVYDSYQLKSLMRSLIVGISIYVTYRLFKDKDFDAS
jgi:hypothetical protein